MSLPRGRRSQHFEPFEPSLSDEIRVKTGLGAHGNRILYTLRWYSCKVGEGLFFLLISCKFPQDSKISVCLFCARFNSQAPITPMLATRGVFRLSRLSVNICSKTVKNISHKSSMADFLKLFIFMQGARKRV